MIEQKATNAQYVKLMREYKELEAQQVRRDRDDR